MKRNILFLISLIVVCLLASVYKIQKFKELPFFNPSMDAGLFTTEGAFQYNYAKKVAEGGSIPAYDKKAQWPEGMYVFKELTIFMEPVHGLTYRLVKSFLPRLPFHVYLIYFLAFFTSLSIVAVYFGVLAAGADKWTGLFCAAFYAFTGASFTRITIYELEHFSLPLIFFSFVLFLYGIKENKNSLFFRLGAGLFLWLALCSWHFTRFYFLVFLMGISASFLFAKPTEKRGLFAAFWIVILFVVLAAIVSPAARYSRLLISPQMGFALVLLIGLGLQQKREFSLKEKSLILMIGLIVGLLFFFLGGGEKAYGHVWSLLKYKLAYFGIKPDEPSKLSFDARVLWQGAFNTATPFFLIYEFGLLLPLAIIGGMNLYKNIRKKYSSDAILLLTITIMWGILTFFIKRLSVFFVFYLALLISYIPKEKVSAPLPRSVFQLPKFKIVLILGCLLFQVREAYLYEKTTFAKTVFNWFPEKSYTKTFLYKTDKLEMFQWIKNNTKPDAVIMSNFELGPSILVYADRAINLQPKFETAKIREKFKTVINALYGEDEQAFYNLLTEYQSDYFLYPINDLIDTGPDSYRFLADRLNLPKNSLVYKFHFLPQSFKYFKLVFRNKFYQIYKISKPGETNAPYQYPYFPIYDEKLFSLSSDTGAEYFYEDNVDRVLNRIKYAYRKLAHAQYELKAGDKKKALVLIEKVIQTGLPDGYIYFHAAELCQKAGESKLANEYAKQAVKLDPGNQLYNVFYN